MQSPFFARGVLTWALFSIESTTWALLFFFVDAGWPSFLVSLVLTIHVYGIWIYSTRRLIRNSEYRSPETPWIPIVGLILLVATAIVHNTALYASIALMDPDAYIGIPSDSIARWRVLYLSLYLAVDTTVIAGSGAVNPNPASELLVGFIPMIFNYLQGVLLYIIIGWGTIFMIQRYGKDAKIRPRHHRPPPREYVQRW